MGKAERTGHAVYRLNYHFVWIPKYRRAVLKGAMAERAKEIFREIAEQYDSTVVFCHLGLDHPPTMSTIGFQSLCQRTLPSVTAKQRDNFQQDGWIETVTQPMIQVSPIRRPLQTGSLLSLLFSRPSSKHYSPTCLVLARPFDYDWVWFNSERGRFVFSQLHCV